MIRAVGIARIAVPVLDLDEARMALTRLGFSPAPRVREPATGISSETVLLKCGALAFTTGQLEVELDVPGLEGGESVLRQIELPEGSIAFRERRRVVVPPVVLWHEEGPTVPLHEEWLAHPNGAAALAGVLVIVEATAPMTEALERALGIGAVTTTDDVLTLRVGTQTVVLADADDAASMYPEAEDFSAVVRVMVADLPRTADVLADWRIDFDEAAGRLLVPPDEAGGVLLELIGPR
ncbi:MAG: hypothetical protein IRZ04_15495 [Rhodospirillales bacterium]|nr:hypothetical protein [Rhodospirillales bacterium]